MLKSDSKTIDDFGEALARAFTRVAQHACRLGESRDRIWPPLSELPEPDSWKWVGEKYSREFALEIMSMYFSKADFLNDLAKLAAKDSL